MADDKIGGWEVRVEHVPLKMPASVGSRSVLPCHAAVPSTASGERPEYVGMWNWGTCSCSGQAAVGDAGATGARVVHWCFLPGLWCGLSGRLWVCTTTANLLSKSL